MASCDSHFPTLKKFRAEGDEEARKIRSVSDGGRWDSVKGPSRRMVTGILPRRPGCVARECAAVIAAHEAVAAAIRQLEFLRQAQAQELAERRKDNKRSRNCDVC